MLIPLQLDNSEVRVRPWVCGWVAIVCFVVQIAIAASQPSSAEVERRVDSYLKLLAAHPDAVVPPRCARYAKDANDPRRVIHLLELKAACDAALDSISPPAWRRFGLTPARGLAQVGVLTGMFVHGGWMHLIGNLLFLYIVGPFLEDRWGHRFFAGFYLIGGVISGLTQALMDPSSTVPIVGASGAIAACMGAFSLLFWQRRVYVLLWLIIPLKKFYMAAWLWGGLWIAGEVYSYATTGLASPVAVLVHIGGFFFGVLVAIALRNSGVDAKLSDAVEDSITHVATEHPATQTATDAFAREDWPAAAAAFDQIAAAEPKNGPALYGATRAYLYSGDRARAALFFDRFLDLCAKDQDVASARDALRDLKPLSVDDVRGAVCRRLAPLVSPEDPALGAALWLRVAVAGADARSKRDAAARARELFFELHDHDGVAAAEAAAAASAASATSPAAAEATATAGAAAGTAAGAAATESPLVVVDAAGRADGIVIEAPEPRLLRFHELAVVGAAAIAGARCVDLRLTSGERVRLTASALAGIAGGDVDDARLTQLLQVLLTRSGARAWPSARHLAEARWPRVDSEEALLELQTNARRAGGAARATPPEPQA